MFSLQTIEKPTFSFSQDTLDEIVKMISESISKPQN